MKITKEQLKKIIKEEIDNVLGEQSEDIEESYGGERLGAYDCKKGPCRGLSGMALERCVTSCIERKEREADKRADKSMSRGW